ncbi:MAG: hypothetical protein U1A77_10025 [Pirellulales bacterium]
MNSDAPRAAQPYQFSIRSLMIVTTLVAGVMGTGLWLGPGAAFPAVLAILLVANWRGVFRFAQTGSTQLRLAWLVSGLFAISLASPCLRGCNNEAIPGWQLALFSATFPVEQALKVATDQQEREEAAREPAKWVVGEMYFTAIFLGNLLLIGAVGLPWLLRRRWPSRWLPVGVAVAATAMAMFMRGDGGGSSAFEGLLFGAWLWLSAGVLLVMLVPMNRRALIAALLSAGILLLGNRL